MIRPGDCPRNDDLHFSISRFYSTHIFTSHITDPLLFALQELDVIEVLEHFAGGRPCHITTPVLENVCLEERSKNL